MDALDLALALSRAAILAHGQARSRQELSMARSGGGICRCVPVPAEISSPSLRGPTSWATTWLASPSAPPLQSCAGEKKASRCRTWSVFNSPAVQLAASACRAQAHWCPSQCEHSCPLPRRFFRRSANPDICVATRAKRIASICRPGEVGRSVGIAACLLWGTTVVVIPIDVA